MEDRIYGAGFAILTALIKNSPVLPVGIKERLRKLRNPISKSRHLTVRSANASTLTYSHDVKGEFYDNLDHVITTAPHSDKLVLLGDFRDRVGRGHSSGEGVIGKPGAGKVNDSACFFSATVKNIICVSLSFSSEWPTGTTLPGCNRDQNTDKRSTSS